MRGGVLKVVAIIQARMGSRRLPGKVLKDLEGETVLARVVKRLRRSTLINEVLVATTDGAADDPILQECKRLAVPAFRGDENDVLDRYFRAAQLTKAEAVKIAHEGSARILARTGSTELAKNFEKAVLRILPR